MIMKFGVFVEYMSVSIMNNWTPMKRVSISHSGDPLNKNSFSFWFDPEWIPCTRYMIFVMDNILSLVV
jgi:hypothetical protein